jgi:uncharacterized lipoprotein YddW (UPF0748 family)
MGSLLKALSLMFLTLLVFNSFILLPAYGNAGNIWEGRGIWVWAWQFKSEEELAKAFANISSLNFNMIYFLVKDSGNISYNSSIRPIRSGYEWDPLRVAVNEAHRLGLEIHAWFVVFYDSWLVSKRPDLAAVDVKGNPLPNWTCPVRAEVRQYNLDLILEIVKNYDVDGIHFDYIRYRDQNYCYCNYCRAEFEREFGIDPVKLPYSNQTWIEWRAKQITSFVQEANAAIKSIKPNIKVSAAVVPDLDKAIIYKGQNWKEWAEKHIVDFLAPMTYTNNSADFQKEVANILRAVNGNVPIYPGISLYELRNVADPKTSLLQQINLTRTLNAQGQAIFNWYWLTYNKTLNQQFTEAIKEAYVEKAIPEFQNKVLLVVAFLVCTSLATMKLIHANPKRLLIKNKNISKI